MIGTIQHKLANLPAGLRQTAIYALAPVIAKGISFVMVPVFTNHLTPEDYGRLDILQTMADLLSIVIGLGLADTLFRFSGGEKNSGARRRSAANIFGISMASGLVFLTATQLVAPWIQALLPGSIPLIEVRIILASLSFSALILVPLGWLRVQDRASIYVAGTAGRAAGQAGLAALFLVLGFGVTGVLAAGLIACVILASILIILQLKQTGIRFDTAAWREYLRFGAPLVLAGMAAFVMSSCDRWFVAAFAGTEALAPYAVAAKFGLMVAMLFQPFEMWWSAKRFELLEQEDGASNLARTARLGVLILAAATVIVASSGPILVTLMTPAAYHEAARYLPCVALICALRSSGTLINIGLYAGRSTMTLFAIEVASALAAVLLFLMFIPQWGAWGAIGATGTVLTLRLAVTFVLAQRARSLPHQLTWHASALVLAGLTVAGATTALTPLHALGFGAVALAVLALVAVITGVAKLPRRESLKGMAIQLP